MPTVVKGQPPSAEVRARLKAENRPVLVAFSLGKDAIATNIALREAGIETRLAYMYLIPPTKGRLLDFIEETITDLETAFGQKIHRYPHPSIYRLLNHFVFQPPERCEIIEAAQLPNLTYETLWALIREDLGLAPDTWVADGVRAADSIVRRASFTRHGVMKTSSRKVSPIHDWLKGEVMEAIERWNIPLPIDYQLFGRSFDGIDRRFTQPLRDNRPEDYARILEWFPLAHLDIARYEMSPQ